MSDRNKELPRRLVVKALAAGITTVVLNSALSPDSGRNTVNSLTPPNRPVSSKPENPIMQKATNLITRVLRGTAKEAQACHFESGPHNCAGQCPAEWVGDAVISAFIYKENGSIRSYDKFDKGTDEVWTTIPKGGRKMRVTLFGCDVEPAESIWLSPEDGDGRAIDLATKASVLKVRKHGGIEDWNWRDGIDKRTGEPAKIAFVRGQIDRFAENGADVHREQAPNHPNKGQLSRWQICIDVCPVGVTPVEITDIFVASGLTAQEVSARGYQKKNGMYVPQYASHVFDRVPEDK